MIELSGRGVEGNADGLKRQERQSESPLVSHRPLASQQVSSPAAPTKSLESGDAAPRSRSVSAGTGSNSGVGVEAATVAALDKSASVKQSLRDICAGKIAKHVQDPDPEEESDPEVLYCRIAECGKAMVQTKGWWVCPDVGGCPMGGIQQKKVV